MKAGRFIRRVLLSVIIVNCTGCKEEPVQLPTDVSSFLEKEDICDFIIGEEGTDVNTGALSDKAVQMGCDKIPRERALLEQKYVCPFQVEKGPKCM